MHIRLTLTNGEVLVSDIVSDKEILVENPGTNVDYFVEQVFDVLSNKSELTKFNMTIGGQKTFVDPAFIVTAQVFR